MIRFGSPLGLWRAGAAVRRRPHADPCGVARVACNLTRPPSSRRVA